MTDRYAAVSTLMRLAVRLAVPVGGMSLDEMAEFLEKNRRTAERARDVLDQVFGLESEITEGGIKRWRLSPSRLSRLTTLRSEHLAAVASAVKLMQANGLATEARDLGALHDMIQSTLERSVFNRWAPDLEALVEAQGIAMRPGPREASNPAHLAILQQGILALSKIRLTYARANDSPGGSDELLVHPLGLLLGNRRRYLVAFSETAGAIRLYRLSRIITAEVLNETFQPPQDFDLQAYGSRSFGVFQEPPQDIELVFDAAVAAEVLAFCFHPTQTLTELEDGRVQVQFTAGGIREVAWHVMTWVPYVLVIKPDSLKAELRTLSAGGLRAVGDANPMTGD